MSLPSVDSLFIEAVAAGLQGRRVRWEPLPPETWKALFPLAQSQKLLPLLVDAVCQCPNALEDPGFPALRGAARAQVLLQTRKDAALSAILARLREADIPVLVVKGRLCRAVYPNGALRPSSDEDLLTEEDRFQEACGVLAAAGLWPEGPEDAAPAPELGWRSPDGLLFLELHQYLFAPDSGPFGLLQTVFEDSFSRAEDYRLEDGTRLRSLSPHDHLLYLLLHAMKHFIHTGFGLRQICDVGLWAARWQSRVDWTLLLRQTEQVRGAVFCAALFRLAEERLGISLGLPASWRELASDPEPMLRDLLEGGVYGSSTMTRAHTARITQDAVAAQRRGGRAGLRSALFPPAESLAGDYPELKAHPALLPLVWQKRLLRYLRGAGASRADKPAETLRLGRQRLALLREYGILE